MEYNTALERARKLLERATHLGTPEHEANSCREKANDIMVKHAIDEAELEATRPAADRIKPESIKITVCNHGSPFEWQLYKLVLELAWFTRTKVAITEPGRGLGMNAVIVGYSSDLKYFEILYTTIFLHMLSEADPKADDSKSFDENVYMFHEAGISYREMVHRLMPEVPRWDESAIKRGGGRCKTAYRRHCKKLGEETHVIPQPIVYQRNFAEGYVKRVSYRLAIIQQNAPKSGALALREQSVKDLLDEMYPVDDSEDGKKARKAAEQKLRADWNAQSAGSDAGNRVDLGSTRMGSAERQQLG